MIPKVTCGLDDETAPALPRWQGCWQECWRGRRLGWLLICGLLAACDVTPPAAEACKRLEILVGFGIGGGTDTFARQLAAPLSEVAGLPVQVANLTAGSGIAAYRELLARPADGCTLLAVTSDYPILSLYEPETIDLDALDFLVRAHAEIGLLLERSGAQGSWPALLEHLRRERRSLLVGGVGARSFDRSAIAIALADQGLRYRYIPYGGAREMQADLLGGRLDAMYEEFGAAKGLLDSGQVEALVVLTENRVEMLPDAATAAELGLPVPPPIWRGIAMRNAVPDDRIAEVAAAVNHALQSETYVAYEQGRYLHLGQGYLGDSGAFSEAVQAEVGLYRDSIDTR